MATQVPLKIYKTAVNGVTQYAVMPGYNTPHGYTETNLADYQANATTQNKQSNLLDLRNAFGMNVNSVEEGLASGGSGYVIDPTTGVLTTQKALDSNAANEAAVAAGTMRKVPIGNGFGYVPVGSAGDLNLQNPQPNQPTTPTPQNTSATSATSTGGSTSQTTGGLQMNYHQVIADTYASRPDLQALYGPDGKAINPNDPRVAGIPTILDWAAQFGAKEYSALQGFTRDWTPAGGGSAQTGGFSTGDSNLDEILNKLQEQITNAQANGQMVNPNIELTPADVQKFLDQAKNEIDPYYASQINAISGDLTRNLTDLQKSYELQKQQYESDFQKNLSGKREQLAGAGLAFSGNRGAQEAGMVADTNRQLEASAQSAASKAGDILAGVEQKVGSRNLASLTMPNLVQYQASNAGNGGFNTARTLDFSRTGNITGDLEYSQNRDVRNLSDYLQGQEIKRRTLNF